MNGLGRHDYELVLNLHFLQTFLHIDASKKVCLHERLRFLNQRQVAEMSKQSKRGIEIQKIEV